MDMFIPLISAALGLIIAYFITKAAVRNGTLEARALTEQYANSELKKAMQDGIKAAIEENKNQLLIGLHNTIQDAIKAAAEQNKTE